MIEFYEMSDNECYDSALHLINYMLRRLVIKYLKR